MWKCCCTTLDVARPHSDDINDFINLTVMDHLLGIYGHPTRYEPRATVRYLERSGRLLEQNHALGAAAGGSFLDGKPWSL
jgi:hypothetical protein